MRKNSLPKISVWQNEIDAMQILLDDQANLIHQIDLQNRRRNNDDTR